MSVNNQSITVLMPVYNGEKYLDEAIRSILGQTFKDFEFLIIDDYSNDKSCEIISAFSDERIKLIKNNKNMGQAITMNKGINLAKGKYIARIDQDDISLPKRLQIQYEYMENNSNVGLLGCNIQNVDENLNYISFRNRPTTHYQNLWRLLYNTCLMHPTAFIRSSVLSTKISYDKRFWPCEDYDLWSRLAYNTKINQLNDVYVLVRKHESNYGKRSEQIQIKNRKILSKININNFLLNHKDGTNYFDAFMNRNVSIFKRFFGQFVVFKLYRIFCEKYKLKKKDRDWIRDDIIDKYPRQIKFIFKLINF